VSNNSFVDQIAFDGVRKHLLQDFTHIYHLDLHGNVRHNPKLSGTTHNVFGIQVGVGITVAVRSSKHTDHRLFYRRVPEFWRKEDKLEWLAQMTGSAPMSPLSMFGGAETSADSTPLPMFGEGPGVGSEITKWDIFYYVYGLLHHPEYRSRYADNLKRELPRIPFVSPLSTLGEGSGVGFWAFSSAGKALAELHLNYETVTPYPLEYHWTPGKPASWHVQKTRLNKDRTALMVNDTLILRGIPPEAFEHRLGNRSALDWIIDQYQVSTDKRSGITSDPNTYSDNPRYIVELVQRVVQVSVETVKIVAGLPLINDS
jgi:predicted helicase